VPALLAPPLLIRQRGVQLRNGDEAQILHNFTDHAAAAVLLANSFVFLGQRDNAMFHEDIAN